MNLKMEVMFSCVFLYKFIRSEHNGKVSTGLMPEYLKLVEETNCC